MLPPPLLKQLEVPCMTPTSFSCCSCCVARVRCAHQQCYYDIWQWHCQAQGLRFELISVKKNGVCDRCFIPPQTSHLPYHPVILLNSEAECAALCSAQSQRHRRGCCWPSCVSLAHSTAISLSIAKGFRVDLMCGFVLPTTTPHTSHLGWHHPFCTVQRFLLRDVL